MYWNWHKAFLYVLMLGHNTWFLPFFFACLASYKCKYTIIHSIYMLAPEERLESDNTDFYERIKSYRIKISSFSFIFVSWLFSDYKGNSQITLKCFPSLPVTNENTKTEILDKIWENEHNKDSFRTLNSIQKGYKHKRCFWIFRVSLVLCNINSVIFWCNVTNWFVLRMATVWQADISSNNT